MPNKPVTLAFFTEDEHGHLHYSESHLASDFGDIPNIGDVIMLPPYSTGQKMHSVKKRYFRPADPIGGTPAIVLVVDSRTMSDPELSLL